MSFGQGVGHLDGQLERLIQSQSLARDQLIQRLACHVLHHDEVDAALAPDIVNGDDVGMVQRRGRPSLLNESPLALGIAHLVWRQHLDGYSPLEPCIARLVDDSHPAGPSRERIW